MKKNRRKPVTAYLEEYDRLNNEADKLCRQCMLKRERAKQTLRRYFRYNPFGKEVSHGE
jgi:hypothetical protein